MSDADRGGQVLLYGVSYGTQLALRALQVNDLHLDGLIFEGLVPLETTGKWDLSRRTALVDQVGRQSMDEPSLERYRTLLTVKDAAWQKEVPGGRSAPILRRAIELPNAARSNPEDRGGSLRWRWPLAGCHRKRLERCAGATGTGWKKSIGLAAGDAHCRL